MNKTLLSEQIQAFGQWKARILKSLDHYRQWLEANGLGSAEVDLRIFDMQDALNADKICIAFVAEFSRGKSELINAIFFSDYKRRLLPSEAGRTTMCPTEIFYDDQTEGSYIRLLPIETRLDDTTIAEYKNSPIHWTQIQLETGDPEKMAEALREVVQVKKVSNAEAEKLGLILDLGDGKAQAKDELVEIPVWRHALISFPHPLLKNGLVVLDTPGLNALGNEPELTLSMLPDAHAILFILGADTGLTKSDLELWQNHIMQCRTGQRKGLLVVLNKIDTLWDELKSPEAITNTIQEQCYNTANQLNLDKQAVIPVSAQKGLLAKVKDDDILLKNSNLNELERVLTVDIVPQKNAIIQDNVISEIRSMIGGNVNILKTRMAGNEKQLMELRTLSSDNAEALVHMMERTKEERNRFKVRVDNFQARRKILTVQMNNMMDALSMTHLDKLINETRENMSGSWTTMGLKSGMRFFFEGAKQIMAEAHAQAAQSQKMLDAICKQIAEANNMQTEQPRSFSIGKFNAEMQKLYHEGEAYRQSKKTTMTEQSFVIKRFFISLVSRARDIFYKANKEAESWSKTNLNPVIQIFKEQKNTLDEKMDKLRQISKSRETVETKIRELETGISILSDQINELRTIEKNLEHPCAVNTTPSPQNGVGSVAAR